MITTEIQIPLESVTLEGDLQVPAGACGMVIFSHGSGSSRLSPRNTMVARRLRKRKMGTLLFDLLTPEEDETYRNRFDIPLLTERLLEVTYWAAQQNECRNLPLGYFGASTGAASALGAAAHLGHGIKAIVSRGGRPDLAMSILHKVSAPTLLLVGGLDTDVLELNQEALNSLKTEKRLEIIPGASHLFEESGALERVADLASDWYAKYF